MDFEGTPYQHIKITNKLLVWNCLRSKSMKLHPRKTMQTFKELTINENCPQWFFYDSTVLVYCFWIIWSLLAYLPSICTLHSLNVSARWGMIGKERNVQSVMSFVASHSPSPEVVTWMVCIVTQGIGQAASYINCQNKIKP